MAARDERLPALIPVNRLERAKGRLAGILSAGERRELALATFTTVLRAVQEAGLRPVVLTDDAAIRVAAGPDALLLPELGPFLGLNAELEGALLRLQPAFPQPRDPRLLVLHADLPLATGEAIRRLVAAAPPAPSAIAVPSGDGGTNAMFVRPPGLFAFAYGRGSLELHRAAAAAAAGVAFETLDDPDLALDLDTPADLLALVAHARCGETAAGRLVLGWDVAGRLG